MIQINPIQFVEKYKLIPKQLRFQFLEFLKQMPYMKYSDDLDIAIFEDLINMLVFHDESADCDNYTYLTQILCDVYSGPCEVYHDVISCLLRYLQWKIPMITERDVIEFNKKSLLRQIREVVAYRPGNHGYELCKAHFESLCV